MSKVEFLTPICPRLARVIVLATRQRFLLLGLFPNLVLGRLGGGWKKTLIIQSKQNSLRHSQCIISKFNINNNFCSDKTKEFVSQIKGLRKGTLQWQNVFVSKHENILFHRKISDIDLHHLQKEKL